MKQFEVPGGFPQANHDFDAITRGVDVKSHGGGIRSAVLEDSTRVNVRPQSSQGSPTLEISRPEAPWRKVKFRYGEDG